jgi:outer membrane receptor protein involved in Fe transport
MPEEEHAMKYQKEAPRSGRDVIPAKAGTHSTATTALRATVASVLLLAGAATVHAQSVSGTLRGTVTSDAAPAGGAKVIATNTTTGLTRSVTANDSGGYTLNGLPPGQYKVDVDANGKTSSQVVALQVGQTAQLDLGVGVATKEVESVTVSATRLFETKTSEVSNYVSLKQIEMLPQNSRNFLQFAETIPGVQFVQGSDGSTELRSGAQSSSGVNVFIDGVGQKNYVARGGLGGQGSLSDSPVSSKGTRGNPFPQLAIGEYKVITSNYKAEFDQVSSAAIVAATKSGTNHMEFDAFYDFTNEGWRASDPFEARDKRKAESEQEQYGVAVGGPIIQDRMHYFVTYEAKHFETPRRIAATGNVPPTGLPAKYAALLGNFSQPFDEDLIFGKIDWTPGDAHLIELSAKLRKEDEIVLNANEAATKGTNKKNDETRIDLRYQLVGSFYLNDAHFTYEDATLGPRPDTNGNVFQLFNGATDNNNLILGFGGGEGFEDRTQKGYGIQDDLTFNSFDWQGGHTIKVGAKIKRVDLATNSRTPFNPIFALDVNDATETPWRVRFGAPIPGRDNLEIKSENKQYGFYLQDDWDVTDKLQVNVGVRYDYEVTPAYLDYVTPAFVVNAINSPATNPASTEFGHPAAPPGLTYAQVLASGGININDFLSTGSNRKAFDGAIAPRLGFSYDLFDDQRNVIFGGAGRSYDRNVYEYLARESAKGSYPTYEFALNSPQHPCTLGGNCVNYNPAFLTDRSLLNQLVAANPNLGAEVFMLKNNIKTPYSDQVSLGMRNRIVMGEHDWNTSVAVAYVESKDGILFTLGDRWGDGTFRAPGAIWDGQPWGFRGQGIPGVGQFLIGTNGVETRATQLLLSLDKPYTSESPWGTTVAYTYSSAEENRSNVASQGETYMFDFGTINEFGWHTSTSVPRHRLVTTGIIDAPWGITASAKLTLATPTPIASVNCVTVPDFNHCYPQVITPDTHIGFKQFDFALQKSFQFLGGANVRLRADVLNVFNSANVDAYNDYQGSPSSPNSTFLDPTSYLQPTRTFKLSFTSSWR